MSKKTILIVGSTLGVELAALLVKAKGNELEPEILQFQTLLTDFLKQPVPEDKSELVIQLQTDLDAQKDLFREQGEEAQALIEQLKLQLTEAKQKNAELSFKPTVEVDGVTYIINHAAYPHTVEDIAGDTDIARKILKLNGQQALTAA